MNFLGNLIKDMKSGRESWRVFLTALSVSTTMSLAMVLIHP